MNLEDALNHTNQNKTQTTTATSTPAANPDEFRPVNISIAGAPHRITCPVSEIQNLENGAEYINQKIRDLRREIKHKNPTNEEFLVLVCLDMFGQLVDLQGQLNNQTQEQAAAKALIEKINKEARSML